MGSCDYKNILVYSMVNLGDVILTTGAVRLLKEAYPQARITMMVRRATADVLRCHPDIDEVLVYDYKAKQRSWKSVFQMAQQLRSKKFDLAISFDRKLRPALVVWLAGIPERVGPSRVFDDKQSRVTWLFTKTIPVVHDLNKTLQAETYQTIIRGFTGQTHSVKPRIGAISIENEQVANDLWIQVQDMPSSNEGVVREVCIALCVKGTFPLKTWPKEYFSEVVKKLAVKYNARFFVVGAPEDYTYAEQVINEIGLPVLNYCGKTRLMDLAALLKKVDFFLTVDTGSAHLAAAIDIPMLVIYGCTSPDRWQPWSDQAKVLSSDVECCPCNISSEECANKRCLMQIKPEMVIGEIDKVLLNAGFDSQ